MPSTDNGPDESHGVALIAAERQRQIAVERWTPEMIELKKIRGWVEGAGYAGGILSAGVDGIKVAEAVALSIVGDPNISGRHQRVIMDDQASPY